MLFRIAFESCFSMQGGIGGENDQDIKGNCMSKTNNEKEEGSLMKWSRVWFGWDRGVQLTGGNQ